MQRKGKSSDELSIDEPAGHVAHPILPDLEALISPETIGRFERRSVTELHVQPFESADSLSGSRFLSVETAGGRRYIVKRLAAEWDWVMRTSHDRQCRQVLAWQHGLIDQLPATISAGVVAAMRDGSTWAILMEDFSEYLMPPGDGVIDMSAHRTFIEAMAGWNSVNLGQSRPVPDGMLNLFDRYSMFSPVRCREETTGQDDTPRVIVEGWKWLDSLLDRDVARSVAGLLDDPTLLCAALSRTPQTIVHGDWKLGNLGIVPERDGQVILLDWGQVGVAPPAVELAWYLAVNSARLPESKEDTIDRYRAELATRFGPRFDDSWWKPQLALSLLGAFVQLGWPKLHGTVYGETALVRSRERRELEWWSERVREGMALISSGF